MTHSTQSSHGFESESLQADVMRFMAIIGFCLVAIFALVRNTDARPTRPPETPVPPKAAPEQPPPATIELPRPLPAAAPAPAPTNSPIPATVTSAPPSPEPPSAVPEPSKAIASSPAPAAVAAEEPGLSLSFTSDGDFLRLVGAGTVELFVVDPAAVEPTLRFDPQHPGAHGFIPASAPGRIYELLPGTIPQTVTNALARRRAPSGPSDGLTWGVKLPAALERDIAEQRAQHSVGTLLIDRHARIRHVPPA